MDIESQQLLSKPVDKFLKWVPIVALSVSFINLIFSVTVLYPWHLELSHEFLSLENSCHN